MLWENNKESKMIGVHGLDRTIRIATYLTVSFYMTNSKLPSVLCLDDTNNLKTMGYFGKTNSDNDS